MKKQILLAIVLTFSISAFSQAPPKKVNDTFSKKFASATDVKWDQEEADEWEAEFKLSGLKMSASFDNNGVWLETEGKVKKKDLPAEVIKAITLDFEGWKMEEIESIETPDFKGYEMVLEKGETETEIVISETGDLKIKKVKVEDEDEEDEEED